MLEPGDALSRILADVPLLPAERVPLARARGRLAAHDVLAPVAVPPHDDSAMDGFAVRAEDATVDAVLRLLPPIAAGQVAREPVVPGTCAPIMTGAPLPDGADAVVILEDTEPAGPHAIRVRCAPSPRENVRPAGGDIAPGDRLVRAGDRLTPARLGLLASVGLTEADVRVRPRVALLASGTELVAPGGTRGPGQIFASNSLVLGGYVEEAGGVPTDLGIAPDDLEALVGRMEQGLDGDVLITTGGVSVGRYDLVKEALARIGVGIDFWKVRIKPGKPLAFGRLAREGRSVTVFGLPGNPVSAAVTFLQFVRPWLRKAQGDPAPFLPVIDAVALEDIPESPGRAKLLRVVLSRGADGWVCRSTGSQSSGVLTSMARAHGLLHRTADQGGVRAGERVRVQLLDPSVLDGSSDDLW